MMKFRTNDLVTYFPFDGESEKIGDLKEGIFFIEKSLVGYYLKKKMNKFPLPENYIKIKEDEINFLSRRINQLKTGNLGILLKGSKGTGKTVSIKRLANESNLPVIILDKTGNDLINDLRFIKNQLIEFDCLIILDEIEKKLDSINNDDQSIVLELFDGVTGGNSKKVIIATSNDFSNKFIEGRPGRVRYTIQYEADLTPDIIRQIIESQVKLSDYEFDELIEFLKSKDNIGIDVIKTIANEISEIGFNEFMKFNKLLNLDSLRLCATWLEIRCYTELGEILEELDLGESPESVTNKVLESIGFNESMSMVELVKLANDNNQVYLRHDYVDSSERLSQVDDIYHDDPDYRVTQVIDKDTFIVTNECSPDDRYVIKYLRQKFEYSLNFRY